MHQNVSAREFSPFGTAIQQNEFYLKYILFSVNGQIIRTMICKLINNGGT